MSQRKSRKAKQRSMHHRWHRYWFALRVVAAIRRLTYVPPLDLDGLVCA